MNTDVRPDVCLALPQGTYRVPYQYRGHLSHKKSLVAFFRQVMMINRDKIVRFGEKFGKKIFATTFFRTEICPCPSEIKKSPSVKFLRAAGQFLSKVAHVTCLDQWESISDKIGSDMRSEAAILLLCLREVVAYYIFSTGLCNCLRMDIFQILEYWWKIYGEWNVLVLSCLARAVCSQIRSKIWSRTCCEQAAIFLFFYELASLLFWVWS